MSGARRRQGLLVFIEGIDGAGKSTLARRLRRRLRAEGVGVGTHREPSDASIGAEAVRRAPQDPLGAALLFTLDRSLARPRVDSLLARYAVVLQDRSYFSTLAYQGARLPPATRRLLLRAQLAASPPPDLVLWLDLPVGEALERVQARGKRSVLERRRTLSAARRTYLGLRRSGTWARLDARESLEALVESSMRLLQPRLRIRARGSRGGR